MSNQSEAKERQGYSKVPDVCGNCKSFTCDKDQSQYNNKIYMIERNLRCGIGVFKVNKTATCNLHEKTEE